MCAPIVVRIDLTCEMRNGSRSMITVFPYDMLNGHLPGARWALGAEIGAQGILIR